MNEMWIIGVVGGGAGAAVGAPLLLRGRRKGEAWTTEQLAGLWLLGTAIAMLLVGIRHGGLLTPGWDQAVEQLTDAMSLVAWTTLVSMTRHVARLTPMLPSGWGVHLALPVAYVAILIATGKRDVPFLWLMPVGVASVGAIGGTWRSARAMASPRVARQVGAVFLFAAAFCAAQLIRSLFPAFVAVREIVPAIATVSFFAIAFALAGSRAGAGATEAPTATVHGGIAGGPRYRKSGLAASEADRLLDALDDRMRSSLWYREPGLSLAVLAARLGVAPQTLSQALNQRRGQSLTGYLAERRLADVRQLLLDPANDCFTIEGLAQRAGFVSRSAFYRVFREVVGVTPAQYRDGARRGRPDGAIGERAGDHSGGLARRP